MAILNSLSSTLTRSFSAFASHPLTRLTVAIAATAAATKFLFDYFQGGGLSLRTAPTPLSDSTDAMLLNLNKWVSSAPLDEKPHRETASKKIFRCFQDNVTSLNLSGLNLSSMPDCLTKLPCVREIYLANNCLTELNSSYLPQNLVLISAEDNELSTVDLRNSKKLESVQLNDNKIESALLPKELTYINLNNNKIGSIDLKAHKKIKELHLNDNYLSNPLILSSYHLLHVSARKNQFLTFPLFPRNATCNHIDLRNTPIQVFPADSLLPKTRLYLGPLPNSTEGRKRLGVEESEILDRNERNIKTVPPKRLYQKERRPRIGLASHHTALIMGSKLPEFIQDMGAKNVPIDLNNESGVTDDKLTTQTKKCLLDLRKKGIGKKSIPIELIEGAHPESPIGKTYEYAKKCISNVEGLMLPGGPHIEPEFYDPKAVIPNEDRDYARTITEFTLVLAAHKERKPVYAICRGAQLLNVLYGGSLKDGKEVGWHSVNLVKSSRKEQIQKLLEGNSLSAFSCHEQCCDKIADLFEVVLANGNLPKLIMSKDGLLIGAQFHLEEQYYKEYSTGYHLLQLFCDATPSATLPSKL